MHTRRFIRASDGSKPSYPFPQPSLHIGMLRMDPWNEFLERGPTSADDLLKFASSSDLSQRRIREDIDAQLTTIAGYSPPLQHASILPTISMSDYAIPLPTSFLFSQITTATPPAPNPESSEPLPSSSPEEAVPATQIMNAPEVESPSIWNRLTSAFDGLRKVSTSSLPSWFTSEQALVIPTDPAVQAVLGSIFGGLKSRILITVRVIEAVDVPVLDWWGTSDPYVCACLVRGVGGLSAGRLDLLPTIGGVKASNPKFATLNPKWNESLQLDPADLLSVISDSVLHVSLWDKDVIKTDDPVGFSTFSLIDALQMGGICPFPILPIQLTGSLIGPHAGVFVKIQLRMVQKVGCLSITPVALQGFTRGWEGYNIRLEVKIVDADPIASSVYVSKGLCQPESTTTVRVNETGHAVWPQSSVSPTTILFSSPKKSKPYLHITLKSDGVIGDAGQISVRIGMLERLGGISPLKLAPLDGSPSPEVLAKCSLYCGVECELIE